MACTMSVVRTGLDIPAVPMEQYVEQPTNDTLHFEYAELLTQASRQIMIDMVSIVFKGLEDIPNVPMTPTTARSLVDLAHSPRLQVSPPGESQGPLLNPFTGDQPTGTTASTAAGEQCQA